MFLFKFITQLNTLLLMVIVINNFYIFFLFLHSFATDNKNRNKAAVFSLIFKMLNISTTTILKLNYLKKQF